MRAVFQRMKDELLPFIRSLGDEEADDAFLTGHFPVDRQQALDHEVINLFGLRPETWRLDHTRHPFVGGPGGDDVRITTHYDETNLDSFFASMHEYGHALYENQTAPELRRGPLGRGCSLGLHESQSRMWENLVGRGRAFWSFFYPRLQETFPEQLGDVEQERFYRAVNRVQPSLIRIDADEVTYNMHIILRFELEQDMIEGRVDLRDLPEEWNRGWTSTSASRCPTTRTACSRTCTGAAAASATSRPTRSATSCPCRSGSASRTCPTSTTSSSAASSAPLREWLGEHCTATAESSRRRRRSSA